jgi:hypothetical protein
MVEQLIDLDVFPDIVPRQKLNDGISAARLLFRDVEFHAERCVDGIRALKSYHREYDEDKKAFKDEPVHDWSSHYADAYRGFSLISERKRLSTPLTKEEIFEKSRAKEARGTNYAFCLEDLWKHGAPRSKSLIN